MTANQYLPFSISPNDQNMGSEDLFAVGTKPDAQEIQWNSNYQPDRTEKQQ